MEIRKSTTAGVMFWTPAPIRTSPTVSVISEDVWEDEDDEQTEKADDFVSQMDENGIIGLAEALEDVRLEETCDLDAECNPAWYLRALTPEEEDPSGCEMDTPPEELSYNLSEHLSHTESPGEDAQILSPLGDDTMGNFKAQTVDEVVKQMKEEQKIEYLPVRDEYLDMTEEEKDGEEEVKRSYRSRKKNEHISTSRKLGSTTSLVESYINKGENEKISWTQYCSAQVPAVEPVVSNHHCPIYQSTSPLTSSTLPHLRHFTAEEIASAPGIEAEAFPDMGFTESLPESHSSCISLKSSPRCPRKSERGELKGLQPAAIFSEPNEYSGVSNGPLKSDKHHKQPTPSPRKMRQNSPEAIYSSTRALSPLRSDCSTSSPDRELNTPRAKTNAAQLNESRSGALSYRTPDFSKVEPRVRFPKGGYKPPKSKRSSKRESLLPEPPLVFKSPADIVKEVLLNTTDGPPTPSDCNRRPSSAPNSTVPQDFRCRQQATTLLEQLQEDYNRLLTKYAEAENTIDRLRLEAKVNLYSDPPKPGHSVQSGLSKEASKIMMLDFPRAQRAETNSSSLHPDRHSPHQRSSAARPSSSASISSTRSPDPQAGQQLAKILYNQADKFLHQLQTFEDLLNSEKLKPFEQVKGLSQLAQGLDSLERGYLLARDEHKLLQQRGAEINHFDPERELDGLIFQCGLHMDELKEQVEQMRQEQPICEAPPSPPPQPSTSSVPSEGRKPPSHPKSPPVPLLVDPGEVAAVEVSLVSEESDEKEVETEDEETLNSVFLKPLNGKHRRGDQDFTPLIDHYQSFKELPKLLDRSLREGAPLSAASKTDMQPGEKGKEGQGQRTGNMEVQRSLPQRQAESDHQDSPPVPSSKQRTSKSNLPSRRASSQSTTIPVHPPSSNRRLEMGKSHSSSLSSLGEITASDRRSSKLQAGTRRVLSQDGIISPETDSGFVGSESSHLTPAAVPSPLQQRASESVSVPQEVNSGKPQTGTVSAPSPSSSLSHRHTALEPSGGSRRRTRHVERRRTFSCSQTDQTRADSGTSEFGLESDCTHTVSEEGQSDQYAESINSLHSSYPSSSPAARCHHGDSLTALSSSQVANRNDAIQTLQSEVTRLKDRIESCLKNKKPLSSVRAAPPAQENCTHQNTSTPRIRSGERRHDVSGRGRERWTVDEAEEESMLRRTARKRSAPAHRQKPQADILTGSELEPSTSRPQLQVSRCTQTSEAEPDSRCSHTNTVRSSRTHPRQDPGVSVQVSEPADEPDSRRGQAPLCPQCLSCHRGRSERPVGGNKESTHSPSSLRQCPVCGCLEPHRSTEPDCCTHTSRKPAKSLDRAARSGYFAAAAPPTLLQCTPVCPPPLLLYSGPVMNSYPPPLYVSPSNSTGTSSGIRGREEVRGRTRRSLSVDAQPSMDSSLNRAIRAAQHMKHTSRHMARSLATGLHYQELLSQSCSY